LRKKIAIVTGASRGIGRAISIKLAKENYNVIIFGRDKKKLNSLKKILIKKGSKSKYYMGDVADQDFVSKSVNEVIKNYKNIDVLINNAGVAFFKMFTEATLEEFKAQIDTNIIGVYNFCKATIDLMIKKQNGTIVNIVSQAGKMGFQYGTTYGATKHAVMGFSRSLMIEVRKHNIRVVAVCPGSVDTDMIEDSPIHKSIKQVLKPKDIADIVCSAIQLPSRALISELDIRPNNPYPS
jgi:short-subunit dehydrogenase